jgi:hypothetical protein
MRRDEAAAREAADGAEWCREDVVRRGGGWIPWGSGGIMLR